MGLDNEMLANAIQNWLQQEKIESTIKVDEDGSFVIRAVFYHSVGWREPNMAIEAGNKDELEQSNRIKNFLRQPIEFKRNFGEDRMDIFAGVHVHVKTLKMSPDTLTTVVQTMGHELTVYNSKESKDEMIFVFRDFINARGADNYADAGVADVQITDYRS